MPFRDRPPPLKQNTPAALPGASPGSRNLDHTLQKEFNIWYALFERLGGRIWQCGFPNPGSAAGVFRMGVREGGGTDRALLLPSTVLILLEESLP